jgi:hypothetical protein
MKKHLKEQVDAMNAFKKFCNDNQIVWQLVVGFANSLTGLGVKTQSIISTESQQEENNKGVTRTKAQKKEDMANEAVAIAHALQAYAVSISDATLYDLMSVVFTTIMKSKDTAAISACQLVFDTASGLPIDAIEIFGVSDAVLNTLRDSITIFSAASPTTRNVKTNKTVLTGSLTKLVDEGNTIMRKQLLKIGRQFKKTNPDFYNGLVENAKVIGNNVHAKIRLTVLDDVTNAPLVDADVVIEGTSLRGKTDSKGKITLSKVDAGKRNVIISKANYTTMTLEQVNFQRGHSITRTVELSPAFDVPAETIAKKETVKK